MGNMSSTGQRYEKASDKFEDAYNKYAGEKGMKLATQTARTEAQDVANQEASRAGSIAGANAQRQARNAGLSKAKSALVGAQASGDASVNSYGNLYNSTYGTTQSNAVASNNGAITARGNALSAAQQEDQNAYNRAWGNVGGVGSMVSGLLTSDARLKESECVSTDSNNTGCGESGEDCRIKKFKDVSSKIGKEKEPEAKGDWALLKVTYTKTKENK